MILPPGQRFSRFNGDPDDASDKKESIRREKHRNYLLTYNLEGCCRNACGKEGDYDAKSAEADEEYADPEASPFLQSRRIVGRAPDVGQPGHQRKEETCSSQEADANSSECMSQRFTDHCGPVLNHGAEICYAEISRSVADTMRWDKGRKNQPRQRTAPHRRAMPRPGAYSMVCGRYFRCSSRPPRPAPPPELRAVPRAASPRR